MKRQLISDEECNKFPAKTANKGCVKDLTSGKFCKEEDLCTTVSLETPSDEECNKYPVSFDKIKTHICIKNPGATGSHCIEQQDTSKSTEGTTDKIGKDNNGNFINASFGLLLINYLLF